ncbi:glycoside hydrolase family 3 N-terminal domain-containing protein [Bacteroides ovatus]|uniref:glycoside hydrolase family 3 N-terminal domain-containing protein n=1 Tax=Bacteroides ovatus TaxID=28116 RepID=UPI002030FB1E|nr:glycoside hydrolase family 3 N-terminal domain-containing protein [Bacteroides ovatus]MCM1719558.1 glycoside hydrolase family 3 C-terminal domain-containing protein [Bacteroides ovatus]MCM1754773.1 glycoside hydrolase family 3 C-terminal domain-containing protein [Bacteroides ovatus]MCM1865147.1 glycoside hydrolase family 3 C-terminal domain-containing protein [Bacteroides ovatus]MCM1910463.1 glycoside hydrolase family 3 C-terminal domain-containing protein [Bacteroides ovatus]
MRKKVLILGLCLLGVTHSLSSKDKKSIPLYKDAKAPIEKRIDDLISRMTLEEKVLQLNQYTLGRNNNVNNVGEEVKKVPSEIGSLIYFDINPELRNSMQKKAMEESRLGIPIIFGYDAIHGFRTIYPISLGQACSWNPGLVEQACAVSAQEARMSGVDWTFSPMIDVARDPRWGRVAEGYGEDPYTNGVFAAASVRGYQGDDMSAENRMAACLKHYVGYGASEAGRDYVYTEISAQTLWDTYLLPYEMGVKAGAATLMSSFNDISGVPGSANPYIMTEILKKRWKHDGFIVSDWGAVEQLKNQGLAATKKDAARYAFNAGLEMDMMSHAYDRHLKELVEEGKVTMAQVDESVRRVLRVKFRLGLFERPYTPVTNEKDRFFRPQSMAVAAQLAAESMVLLKNDNQILPLTNKKKIAVVGPMAKNGWDLLGSWCGHGKDTDVEMLYDGLTAEFGGDAELRYAMGCKPQGNDRSGFAGALDVARWSDVVIVCLGEMLTWSGENASRSTIALPQIQEELVKELKEAGKPVILVLSNGRPLELNRMEPLCDAILEIWQPGINGARSMAGILSGRINPSGKLAMTFPYSTGQIPIYYNRRKSGRGHQGFYKDITSDPLYPFGHGLSYTEFKYGTVTPSATKVKRGDKLSAEVTVTNTGARDGAETVHWFISDPYCSITRPVKELKHFEKQFIKAGETKTFRFDIDLERDFGFVNEDGKRFLEAGEYHILVQGQTVKIELID